MEVTRDQLEIMKFEALKDAPFKKNLYEIIWERALLDSASFVEQHLANAMLFKQKEQLWTYAIKHLLDQKGIILEFGVFKGASINFFAKHLPEFSFYGFDSFEGLQEDWKGHQTMKGHFSLGGELPPVENNVTLIKGWFNETLPDFLEELEEEPKLFHIDSDTYESGKYVMNEIAGLLKAGVFVLFDEHHGYPNWREGEYLAWLQVCEQYGIEYEYLGFSQYQALVKITANASLT